MFNKHTLSSLLVTALWTVRVVNGALVSRDLNIQNANLDLDGVTRVATTADGIFPGPTISGNSGDQFLINVIDSLTNSTLHRATSIHWHGLFQAHTTEMDGPAFVSQCPIVPGHAFRYNFTTPGQSGTFWYHSHLSTQYCDGLRGPLVLYEHEDPNDPLASSYDIDDSSTIITLADWYHSPSTLLFPNPGNATPVPDSTLINGLGRWAGGDFTSPLSVVRAQVGKRHRFRIVNMSCFPSYNFTIDGHNMTVIEADGIETEPYTVDNLQIFAAQRYSVIVTADQPVDNYWIRAIPSAGNATTVNGVNSAILRYDGAQNVEPTSTPLTITNYFNEGNLHPLVDPGAPGPAVPGGADYVQQLNISRPGGQFEINGTPFNPPSVPVLLQILSGSTSAGSLLPNGSIYYLPPNQTIELSFSGGGNHPFHLHGHAFDVIRLPGTTQYNFANPVRRDTVSIGGSASDHVTIRFKTDNPGPWFLHCHIDWHLEGGLAVVMAEDIGDVSSNDPPNSDWQNLCPLYAQLNPDSALGPDQ